jgi:hypothetical protein
VFAYLPSRSHLELLDDFFRDLCCAGLASDIRREVFTLCENGVYGSVDSSGGLDVAHGREQESGGSVVRGVPADKLGILSMEGREATMLL